jgi:hypothetical protein
LDELQFSEQIALSDNEFHVGLGEVERVNAFFKIKRTDQESKSISRIGPIEKTVK